MLLWSSLVKSDAEKITGMITKMQYLYHLILDKNTEKRCH